MRRGTTVWVLAAALGALASAPAPAAQRITTARIRAPQNQGRGGEPLPTSPNNPAQEPWEKRTERRPLRREAQGFHPFPVKEDREVPTFYGDPTPRIWNGRPTFGAAIHPDHQPAIRNQPRPSVTASMFGPGGLKVWLRKHISRDRAKRYYDKLEGLKLLERYRAEKAMLGLCPVDDDERPRLIIEGKSFSQEGYCLEHSREFLGERVDWALEAAEERRQRRANSRVKFLKRWHTGSRFSDGAGPGESHIGVEAEDPNAVRATLGQPPRPAEFPRAGDLGPRGTLPLFADPRDPAGFPYNVIDPTPDKFTREPAKEEATWVPTQKAQRSWADVSQAAP